MFHIKSIKYVGFVHVSLFIQPIADRVALNLEIISKNLQFSTKRTWIYHLLLGTNCKSHGQKLVR